MVFETSGGDSMSIADKLNTPQAGQPVAFPVMLKQNGTRLKTIAPAGTDINRFSAALMAQIRSNTKLAECNQFSIMGAFINSTQLGLEPGASLGHCYFVPFKGECQLVIGYRGMIELAYRSGKVLSIAARTIHQADRFDYSYGITDVLEHKPATGDRGPLIGVYAVAKLVGGGVHFEVLDLSDIEQARKASKAGTFGPWKDHFEEMAKKTAIRRLFKYLPVGTELNRAVAIDERGEAGTSDNKQVAESVLDGDFEVIGGEHDPS
jgi:recombination protein RecT